MPAQLTAAMADAALAHASLANASIVAASPDGGILAWIDTKTVAVSSTLVIVAGALAVLFAIWYVIKSGFRFPAILMAALSAGFFLWVVNNPQFVADLFSTEIETAPAPGYVVDTGVPL